MAEDRFANVFTAQVTTTGANVITFVELVFGMTLRDRIAVVIDELLFYPDIGSVALMTATGDQIIHAITVSDQVTDLTDLSDRRILYAHMLNRTDQGTAASGVLHETPLKASFFPPLIVLPNRIFFGLDTVGLAATAVSQMRMHYRTVSITQDQQLLEVLEAFQLST